MCAMFLFRRRPIDLPEAVHAYLDAPRPDPTFPGATCRTA
jgi:hypothetical protein